MLLVELDEESKGTKRDCPAARGFDFVFFCRVERNEKKKKDGHKNSDRKLKYSLLCLSSHLRTMHVTPRGQPRHAIANGKARIPAPTMDVKLCCKSSEVFCL